MQLFIFFSWTFTNVKTSLIFHEHSIWMLCFSLHLTLLFLPSDNMSLLNILSVSILFPGFIHLITFPWTFFSLYFDFLLLHTMNTYFSSFLVIISEQIASLKGVFYRCQTVHKVPRTKTNMDINTIWVSILYQSHLFTLVYCMTSPPLLISITLQTQPDTKCASHWQMAIIVFACKLTEKIGTLLHSLALWGTRVEGRGCCG